MFLSNKNMVLLVEQGGKCDFSAGRHVFSSKKKTFRFLERGDMSSGGSRRHVLLTKRTAFASEKKSGLFVEQEGTCSMSSFWVWRLV